MKRILSLLCVGSLAFALPMSAQTKRHQRDEQGSGNGRVHAAEHVARGGHARVNGRTHSRARASMANTHVRVHNRTRVARVNSPRTRVNSSRTRVNSPRTRMARRTNVTASRNRNRARTVRQRNVTANNRVRTRNRATANRERNISRNRNVAVNRERNARIVNHWGGTRFSGRHYAAFRNYRREWHNRVWWRGHYDRIEFVLGGWWYWDAGYWYPAWGYAPYAYYPYYGPIYTGYATLTPYQVTVQVQIQLQREGYYYGAIDGVPGPETRRALAQFQADHGLAITSAIDEPTLATLGLT
jgi:Putative peptidoglycan binding domain